MNQLENSLQYLKADLVQMWRLVISQIEKTRLSILNNDKGLARGVRLNERRVDAFDLKIDMDCENILMLKNPVATDMRFVISVLKINYNLERIGDYANTFAKITEGMEEPLGEELINAIHLPEMYFVVQSMLNESLEAFEKNDRSMVDKLFELDKKLDKYNTECNIVIEQFIKANPNKTQLYLKVFTIIKKLERAGDHVLNICEELVFLFEATVIRHSKLSKHE